MQVLETERLRVRYLTPEDAPFILELLNQPSFIANIADRGVRSLDDARGYIAQVSESYTRHGFGLYHVALKATGEPVGMCGLLKRDVLDDVDIGYALLERFHGQGYGYEAAAAVMAYGLKVLNLGRIVGITSPDNTASIRVLEKIGLRFDRIIHLPGYAGESSLFVPSK